MTVRKCRQVDEKIDHQNYFNTFLKELKQRDTKNLDITEGKNQICICYVRYCVQSHVYSSTILFPHAH